MNVSRIWLWLQRRAENIAALMLASMFATFLIQIIFRYLLNLPLGWTVEYVTVAWLWGILFGYAFVVRDADIVRLDLVYLLMPRWMQRVADVVGGLVIAGILLWSLPKAFEYVTFMKVERTAFMRISFDIIFAIYLPFAVTVVIRSLINVWGAITNSIRHPDIVTAATSHDYD